MARLRREVASVMQNEAHPSREQIRKMPFLSCVIKESMFLSVHLQILWPGKSIAPDLPLTILADLALRLYPSVPLNNREAIRTTILPTGGGSTGKRPILVRKGELVVYSQYVNSRMKSIYGDDAPDFRPERWETGEMSDIGWAYFPFSGGPRQCLGEDFALMEVSYTLVRLLQTFANIELPEGEAIDPVGLERQRLTLVLSSADGCRVTVKRDG